MGAAAPVARLDDIALARQLAMGGDVVDVAADGDRAVAIGLDEALDTAPAGYASGRDYASVSLSNAFLDIESWLSGLASSNMRSTMWKVELRRS
jgi:hypothetical protein